MAASSGCSFKPRSVATRKSYDKSQRRPADLHLPALPPPPPLPPRHHRRHCQPTVGSSVLLSLQARRVYPATLKPPPLPPTKLGVAQTQQQRWITVCGSACIFEDTGLRKAVILVQQLQDSLPPPMRALSLFAVASFTLLIKPLSESEASVAVAFVKCQLPCATDNLTIFFSIGTLGRTKSN